jgi:uncharacterized C2H2 Zn-finger protein
MPLGASQHRGSQIPEVSAAVLLSPDEVLQKCPHCGAWPMSAGPIPKEQPRRGELAFKCAQCGAFESCTIHKPTKDAPPIAPRG